MASVYPNCTKMANVGRLTGLHFSDTCQTQISRLMVATCLEFRSENHRRDIVNWAREFVNGKISSRHFAATKYRRARLV
jgi:hypothetical protein